MTPRLRLLTLALVSLSACGASDDLPEVVRLEETTPIEVYSFDTPPDNRPGVCWARDEISARPEPVGLQSAATPTDRSPDTQAGTDPVAQTDALPPGDPKVREVWFRTPCADDLTEATIASLQRALAARGLFDGPVTGVFGAKTRAAVRSYQSDQGLDSAVLSRSAAERLGLLPEELAAETEPPN